MNPDDSWRREHRAEPNVRAAVHANPNESTSVQECIQKDLDHRCGDIVDMVDDSSVVQVAEYVRAAPRPLPVQRVWLLYST